MKKITYILTILTVAIFAAFLVRTAQAFVLILNIIDFRDLILVQGDTQETDKVFLGAITAQLGRDLEEDMIQDIYSYMSERKMPLANHAEAFVSSALEYNIDYRLLPAISVKESSGGKYDCDFNPFGFGDRLYKPPCRLKSFSSYEEAIDYVAWNLGGHNPETQKWYNGGSEDDLWSYNGSVDSSYPQKVLDIMDEIHPKRSH